MVTLAEVMDWGLYLEEVQQIAREHGLPVSRTKDELIQELIDSGELDPAEVVAYVRVDMLRTILQEMGLPSGAGRDALAARLVEALSPPSQVRRKARKARPKAAPAPSRDPDGPPPAEPDAASSEASSDRDSGRAAAPERGSLPINLHLSIPSGPPPIVEVHLPKPERPSAAWGFAGIVMAAIVGGVLYAGVSILGPEGGVLVAVVSGGLLAVILLLTARWWVPRIDRLAR